MSAERKPLRRPGSLRATVLTVGVLATATATATFGGLAVQMANGGDPALSAKVASAAPDRSTAGSAGNSLSSERRAQPQRMASVTPPPAPVPAPALVPAPVVTQTS